MVLSIGNNTFYIPLRNNLGTDVRKFGRIGYSVPSQTRPRAGLDFRHALIINDASYIEMHKVKKIPEAQYRKIEAEYSIIEREFSVYLNRYIKAAKKKRNLKEPLFRDSSLINFHKELGIE